jgi:alpha-1,6-rhamnosyltransferase
MVIKVSVLVAVYNGTRFLPDMLRSVQQQTFQDYELVLVNDASTDNSLAIMEAARSSFPNMQIVTYEKNKTLPGALNAGLAVCQGEYLFRLDADDMLTADCLAKLYDFLQNHPDYDGVICDELKVDEYLQPKYMLLKLLDNYYIKKQNLFRTAFGGPTSMIKRAKYIEAGLHDERMKYSSDKAIGLDLHNITKIGHIPERLYIYREHGNNISQKNKQFTSSTFFKQAMREHVHNAIGSGDYINDWEMVKRFVHLPADYMQIRRTKYANVILKCAIALAKKGARKEALEELRKAEYVHPKPAYKVFKTLITLGAKSSLDKWLLNMNVWTDYAYDDFYLYTP